jgi:hypothetical protein
LSVTNGQRAEDASPTKGRPAPPVHLGVATETLGSLVLVGLTSELSYMTAEQATAARELEVELLADAAAGCDLRVRLIGAACSPEGAL